RATADGNGVPFPVSLMPYSHDHLRSRCVALLIVGAALLPALLVFQSAIPESVLRAQDKVDFTAQIAPILAEHCYECHGVEKGRGKLRMHTRALAMKGGSTGPLFEPGNSAGSYMLTRLRGEGDEDQMPLDKDPLSEDQI